MTVLKIVDLVASLFMFLAGLLFNLLAFYTFLLKVSKKATPIDVLLLNLTISDILLLLFLPLKMMEVASYVIWTSPLLCLLTDYFIYGSVYIGILFLTTISLDRYLAVAHPIKYKLNRRPIYAVVATIFIWLLVCSHYSLIYISHYQDSNGNIPNSSNTSHCYDNFSPDVIFPVRLELCLLFFCLPFAITIFCYVKVIQILNSLPNIQACKKQRAVRLALATLLSFVICFGPFNISHIVGFIQQQSPPWRVESFLLSTLNTVVDPVIFFFSSKAIRQTFTGCWTGMCCRLQTLVPWCSWPCCKSPTDNDGEAGAGRYSSSYFQAGATQTKHQTTSAQQQDDKNSAG